VSNWIFIPSSAFSPLGAQFDGTNDYMRYTGAMTGNVDSKLFLMSFWINCNTGTDGTRFDVFYPVSGAEPKPIVQRTATTDRLYFSASNTSNTAIQSFGTADNAITAAAGWQHCLIYVDAAGNRYMYINDVLQTDNSDADTNDTMDLTPTTNTTIGAKGDNAANKLAGDLAEFWIIHAVSFDPTVEANRRLFYSADGKPVDLGTDGTAPGLGSPVVYCSLRPGDAASDFATNRGQGEDLTITGALTLSATNPGD